MEPPVEPLDPGAQLARPRGLGRAFEGGEAALELEVVGARAERAREGQQPVVFLLDVLALQLDVGLAVQQEAVA